MDLVRPVDEAQGPAPGVDEGERGIVGEPAGAEDLHRPAGDPGLQACRRDFDR